MYSFDESAETAQETYSAVCRAYERILERLRLPVVKGTCACTVDTPVLCAAIRNVYNKCFLVV